MKKKIIIVFLAIFLIILGFLIFVLVTDFGKKDEKDYVSEFTTIGEEAYSEYYYQVLLKDKKTEAAVAEFLKGYETIGLSFDLAALRGYAINMNKEDYLPIIDEFLENNKKCNENNTMVLIYPKSPYTNIDFTSEIKMNCNVK